MRKSKKKKVKKECEPFERRILEAKKLEGKRAAKQFNYYTQVQVSIRI